MAENAPGDATQSTTTSQAGDTQSVATTTALKPKSVPARRKPIEEVPSSLFIFSDTSLIRRFCKWLCTWKPFDMFILGAICANCIVMAMDVHLPNNDKVGLSLALEELEPVFMCIFTFECIVKIIASGFLFHKGAYLHNAWNMLDFVVVASGAVEMMPKDGILEGINVKGLKTVRVLRPLKLVSGLPSLQLVVKAILCALAPIMQIGVLLLFANVIFAIVGLEFYSGAFHYVCVYDRGNNIIEFVDEADPRPCSKVNITGSNLCPEGSACKKEWIGPNSGITSFDNIFFAMLTVFQCVSMEGWTDVMYLADDALGDRWNWLFFVPLIVVGSFFMLNLVLGVLSGEFAKERERVEQRNDFIAVRAQQNFERELNAYFDWITYAEELVLDEKRTNREERRSIAESRRRMDLYRQRMKTEEAGEKVDENIEEELEDEFDEEEIDEDEMPVGGAENNEEPRRRQKTFIEKTQIKIKIYRNKARKTVKTSVFYWAVIGLVFLNTVTTAVEHYNQPQWLTSFLEISNIFFLTIFIFEMCYKIFALGLSTYWKSSFNKFDCVVIAGSTLEMIYGFVYGGSFGISVLRVLRLLRMFKMTPYWISLKNLVKSMMSSIKNIMSLLVLLFLFILIFALLGMQMFGGKFSFKEGRPFYHFDTFPVACVTVFQIITAEDWNAVMYTAIDATGGIEGGGMFFSIYFVFIMLLGNYTLLNVFLAIAVDNLAQSRDMTADDMIKLKQAEIEKERLENEDDLPEDDVSLPEGVVSANPVDSGPNASGHDHEDDDDDDDHSNDEDGPKPIVPYSSCFLFGTENLLRIVVHNIVQTNYFETFILIVIIMSSAAMATEDPVDEKSEINRILGYLDLFFTFTFAAEMYLKIIDQGFALHYGAYLRDFWNVLDFIVVSGAQFTLAVQTFGSAAFIKRMSILKSIKVIRVLRPLKTIKRIPKLKAVFDCVVNSVKNVFNILIVYYIFQFIFAVIAVQLFKGKFFYCTDYTKKSWSECQGEYLHFEDEQTMPVVMARLWLQRDFNYDSTLQALLTLFVVTTGEGWPGIRQASMDATFEDVGPSPFFRIEISLYYILFFIVFPFFFVNIFVALIIITFQEQGNDQLGELLEKNEKQCIEYALNAQPKSLYMPENKESGQYKLWVLVTSPWFEWTIMSMIVINTVILMTKYDDQPLWQTEVLNYINLFLLAVFTTECVLKVSAYGPANYMKDGWNKFDFITVAGSIVDLAATELEIQMINLSFLRLFKAARLVRLLQKDQSIRTLMWTFLQSLQALPYVCLLIAMLFFIYAIIGMQLFGNMYLNDDTTINRLNNFQVFLKALMLLFRCATGEAWHEIMINCMPGALCAAPDGSVDYAKGPVCGSGASVAFFISFVFLSSFLMLNLFVAVIMDNFDYLTRDSSILGSHHLPDFITAWSKYDPAAIGRIHYSDMYDMLREIPPPLGFGNNCPYKVAYKHLIRMNMPVDDNGTVNFTNTLFALIREGLDINMGPVEKMGDNDEELRQILKTVFPLHCKKNLLDLAMPNTADLSYQKLTVGKIYSAKLIVECRTVKMFGEGIGFPMQNKKSNKVNDDLNTEEDSLENSPDKQSDEYLTNFSMSNGAAAMSQQPVDGNARIGIHLVSPRIQQPFRQRIGVHNGDDVYPYQRQQHNTNDRGVDNDAYSDDEHSLSDNSFKAPPPYWEAPRRPKFAGKIYSPDNYVSSNSTLDSPLAAEYSRSFNGFDETHTNHEPPVMVTSFEHPPNTAGRRTMHMSPSLPQVTSFASPDQPVSLDVSDLLRSEAYSLSATPGRYSMHARPNMQIPEQFYSSERTLGETIQPSYAPTQNTVPNQRHPFIKSKSVVGPSLQNNLGRLAMSMNRGRASGSTRNLGSNASLERALPVRALPARVRSQDSNRDQQAFKMPTVGVSPRDQFTPHQNRSFEMGTSFATVQPTSELLTVERPALERARSMDARDDVHAVLRWNVETKSSQLPAPSSQSKWPGRRYTTYRQTKQNVELMGISSTVNRVSRQGSTPELELLPLPIDIENISELDRDTIERIQEKCKGNGNRACKFACDNAGAKAQAKSRRDKIKSMRAETEIKKQKKENDERGRKKIQDEVEDELQKSFLAKVNTLDLMGLDSSLICVDNDGLYLGDTLLNLAQSETIIRRGKIKRMKKEKEKKEKKSNKKPKRSQRQRGRRSAAYRAEFPNFKWDVSSPIRYTFFVLSAPERVIVNAALAEMSSKVGCISFQEVAEGSATAPFMRFVRTSNNAVFVLLLFNYENVVALLMNVTLNAPRKSAIEYPHPRRMCAASNIGQQPVVTHIFLNFACSDMMGRTMHEIMHAMGVMHAHMRVDRDVHINIDESNILPQLLTQFAMVNVMDFSTYGVPYEFNSIMHYSSTSGAVDPQQEVITLVNPVTPSSNPADLMGQRVQLKPSDVLMLKRAYCCTCTETIFECSLWIDFGYYALPEYKASLEYYCPISTGVCQQGAHCQP